jgi:glycosyltransferase involved in cell wall biosynthesis
MNTTPTTILQVLPRLQSGGVERGTVEITQAIKAAGMLPLVASAGGAMVPHITHAGGEHITLKLDSKNPLVMKQNSWKLDRIIRERGVALIHARSRAPGWSAYLAAQSTGIPFVTTFHGVYGTEGLFKHHYNSVMTRSDRIIAVSEFVRQHIMETYDVAPERIRLIPRGVDFSVFDATRATPDRIEQLTKSWCLPDERVPVIFCPGRISRIKGQHVFIEALARINDLPFLAIIAGTDEGHEDYREELEKQVIAAGMAEKVRIAGPTQAMTEAYLMSDLVVVPSIKPESFGRVAIEAQAMGLAVVATDHGGARETIIPNETGYLVPPADAASMAEAMRFALGRDAATAQAMGDFARQHVASHFSAAQMQDKTIALYRELLEPQA